MKQDFTIWRNQILQNPQNIDDEIELSMTAEHEERSNPYENI